jgi:uncharacterized paraquat-inducible protein A
MNDDKIIQAHKHSSKHRAEIEASGICGCFYCRETFAPAEIKDWVDRKQTAHCPRCGIDSVIGDASGFPVTDKDFLKGMHEYWF